jgi:hypothetical protein
MTIEEAHRFYSAHCFNAAWELIDKPSRTDLENEQMLLLANASLWHWTQRADCTAKNLSIGYWQLSRIHALLGDAVAARRAGELSLRHGANESPFIVGYAHEALARAAMIEGDNEKKRHHLAEAKRNVEKTIDSEERKLLEADLLNIA